MAESAARLELERAYRVFCDCQEVDDQERQLRAALVVIAAWEGVSHEVLRLCSGGLLTANGNRLE